MTEQRYRYFTTYSGVSLPLKLMEELPESGLANRNTYFLGEYDADDRLIALEKRVYGEVEMSHRYQYGGAGELLEAEITDADGETTVLHMDPSGKPKR